MQTLGIHQLRFDSIRRWGSVPSASPELLRRVQDHGFLDPVVVRPLGEEGAYDVLTHPEMVVAAGLLEIADIPVVIHDDFDEDEINEIVCAWTRGSEQNPILEAEFFAARRRDLGSGKQISIAEVARLSDTTRTHVSRALSLLTLPRSVKESLRCGHLSAGHGHLLVPLRDPEAQKRLAQRALKKRMSVRVLRDAIGGRVDSVAPRSSTKSPDIVRLESAVSGLLGSPVSIDQDAGTLSVDYFGSVEILQGILERLGYRG